MKRDAYHFLRAWKASTPRKPLLLSGARQVGKTWLLREFARAEYSSHVYLNFEEDPRLDGLFEIPREALRNIELYTGRQIRAGETLVVLDEIQASNRALNALKHFCEEAPEHHVAGAGSLRGIRVSGPRSFPVGKVDFLHLPPMSFLEYLEARGESGLRERIEGLNAFVPLPEGLHQKLVDLLRGYYFVGGMPEAVAAAAETGDLERVREVQRAILRGYELDFAQHAAPADIPKLSIVWQSIPAHLARENKKFMFSAVRPGARAREYENALAWLADAGLVYRVHRVSTARAPLSAYADPGAFKVYALDVGLLSAMVRVPASMLVEGTRLFTEFAGALVENYVAQQLARAGQGPLYYWSSQGGRAELDFLAEHEGLVWPLEVKAGVNPKSKSLASYDRQFSPPLLSRANLLNLRKDGRVANYPLYAVALFPAQSYASSRNIR